MITALVGAQFGSEAKGAVAAALANDYDIHVRTGGPNAGHTIYFNGKKYAMQSIPCGWINKEALLVIGPGGMIELDILKREIGWIEQSGLPVKDRLLIDPRALILNPAWHGEGGVDGKAHALIGSTGKGVGPCRMAHLARNTIEGFRIEHAGDHRDELESLGCTVLDVPVFLNKSASLGWNILLEGTQGSGLSSVTGPWPYCTSADTNAGQMLVDAGLAPGWLTGVILVARTFPIRVAGNSGPLPGETIWEAIGQEPETTTVTKKVRRVARFDRRQFRHAQMLNSMDAQTALMFIDYIDPECKGAIEWDHLTEKAREYIRDFAVSFSTELLGVGTGPETFIRLGDPK